MAPRFDATPDELKLFLDEADEHLQALDHGLLHLERQGSDPEVVQTIFRSAHTLKGSAGAIGHTTMARLTHSMESVLDDVRHGRLAVTTPLIDALLQSLDLLRLLNHQVRTGEDPGLDIEPTRALLATFGRPEAAPAPAPSPAGEPDGLAAAAGGTAWRIEIMIDTATGLQAARALHVLLELNAIGQVIASNPCQADIEQGRFADHLEVVLVSQWEAPLIHDLLSHIGDLTSVTIQPHVAGSADLTAPPAVTVPASAAPGPPAHASQTSSAWTHAWDQPRRLALPTPATSPAKTVRMDVARLDRLMNLVGELVIDRTRLVQLGSALDRRYADDPLVDQLAEAATHVGRITDQLQDEIMKGRMLPIAAVFNKLPRLVRDLASQMRKQVELTITGEATELDRSVLEALGDPLLQLVRNAVDHGLEPPDERLAAGKPATGQVRLSAHHADNQIIITIGDDGRGIDPATIKAAAVGKGLITQEAAARLTAAEAIDLIFTPGFSTATALSDISGRGVGLDIVRTNIARLNGSVQVATTAGQGTTFVVRLPLTLAIVQALLVEVCRQTYAIPIAAVIETLRIDAMAPRTMRGQEAVLLGQRILPILRLDRSLGLAGPAATPRHGGLFVVAVRRGDEEVGLVVDRLVGEQEIVIKPFGRFMGDVPGLSGAAILGDGGVALILDIPGLVRTSLAGRRGG